MNEKKYLLLVWMLVWLHTVYAQPLFNNNGADIYVKDGGFVIIKTNSLYNNQVSGTGTIANEGTIVVEGNITNDANITGASDTIRLSGNWINNSVYAGNNSWADMYGANQLITGTAITTFNNLNLGGGSVVKRQQGIDAVTSGVLALNDAELATDVNEMLVSNQAITAITRNNGYVSSIGAGKLSRATNTTGTYFFPTGSPSYNNPPSIFRPIEFNPAGTGANTYGAMVVKANATNDGYDISTMDDLLCLVNPHFYHRLYHSAGTDQVSLSMFYDQSVDDEWTDQAHWDNPNRWNNLGTASTSSTLGFSTVTVNNVGDFQPEPFALARKKFTVDAGPDVAITLGQSTIFAPVVSVANIVSYSWTPALNLSCASCETPEASPGISTPYLLVVEDNAGCQVADSLVVTVFNPELLIPTAFSPNGDGVNDAFRALNTNLSKFNLQVWNRWGEKVYETNDPREGWDGVFQGIAQPLGVYVWQCSYAFSGVGKDKTAKGNVTLVR